jgi:hypothetical protein
MVRARVRNAYYLFVTLMFLEAACGGLMHVAVYGSLVERAAPPYLFELNYALSILPGLLFAVFVLQLAKLINNSALVLASLYSLTSTSFGLLWLLDLQGSIVSLLSYEFLLGCVGIYSYPALQALTRRVISDENALDVGAALRAGTLAFSGSAVFGVGVGGVVFPALGLDLFIELVGAVLAFNSARMWFLFFRNRELLAIAPHEEVKIRSVYVEDGCDQSSLFGWAVAGVIDICVYSPVRRCLLR